MSSSYVCCKAIDSNEDGKINVQNTELEFYFSDQKNKAFLCSIHPLKTPQTLIYTDIYVYLFTYKS